MADALGTPPSAATPTVGVVSDEDHRLDQGGMFAVQGPSALDIRTGVLVGPGSTALVTGTAATGTMTVSIAPHHWVTSRATADGVYLGTKEASTTVNIAAAPGANSRIDVVYVKQNDSASTVTPDGSTGEVYGVVAGTAAASPTKPALPVGAIELATVQVAAGATSTNGAGVTITNTARQTVARGGIIPARATDTDAGAYIGEYRDHPVNGLERWDGNRWGSPGLLGAWTDFLKSTGFSFGLTTTAQTLPGSSGSVTVPPGRTVDLELSIPQVSMQPSSMVFLQLTLAAGVVDAAQMSTTSTAGGQSLPAKLNGSYTNTGTTSASVSFGTQAWTTSGSAALNAAGSGAVRLRYRIT